MGQRKKPMPGLEPVRVFPYYKIQVWNNRVSAWQDIQKKFNSLDSLGAYALAELPWSEITRIVIVEAEGRRRVDDCFDAFGEPRTDPK